MSSSNSNNNNNDGNNKKKIVCNPYAKKKKKTAPQPPVPSTFAYAPSRSSNTNNSNSNNNNNGNHSGGSRNSYNNSFNSHNNSGGGGGGDTNSQGNENDTLFGTENMSFLAGSFSQAFHSIDETPNFRRASDSFQELKEKKSSSSKKKKKDNKKNSSTITATNTTTTTIGSSNSNNISSGNRDGASLSGPTKSINNTNYNNNTSHNYNNNTNQKKEDDDVRLQHTMLQPHVLYVSPKQKGNSLLPLIRNVPIAYSAMIPDYIMGPTSCALFLSIKYHKLYPEYIYRRIAELGNNFLKSRIILVYVDVEDNTHALQQLNIIGVRQQYTVILCWSQIEAARYLETFKAKDGKTDISCITKKESTNIVDRVTDFLTSGHRGIGGVNKTDAATLWTSFGTIQAISCTSKDELALCPGMGPLKVRRLYDAFHKPFSKFQARERKQQQKRKRMIEEEEARAKTEQQGDDDENEDDGNDDDEKNSNNNEDEKDGQEYEFE